MRRADRLFAILQILRRGKVARAVDIAAALDVTPRTIYRDVSDLMAHGVPIDGAAGVGYILRPGYDLPPLMFDQPQLEALVLGARIVESWGDPELAMAAADVIAMVRAVVPPGSRRSLDEMTLWAPQNHYRRTIEVDGAALRRAVRDRRKIRFAYRDGAERPTERHVRPLALAFSSTRLNVSVTVWPGGRSIVRCGTGRPVRLWPYLGRLSSHPHRSSAKAMPARVRLRLQPS